MSKRALSADQKNLKQSEIIHSALKLLQVGKFPLPSVNEVAEEAGIAKGTIYLYFKSKEEIYLSAMALHMANYMADMLGRFEAHKPCVKVITKGFLELAEQQPKIIYLAHIAPLVLENNISDEFIVGFKKGLLEMTLHTATAIHKVYGIPKNAAKEKFLLGYNIFIGMHQHSFPPAHIQSVLEKNDLLALQYNFSKRLSEILEKLWEAD